MSLVARHLEADGIPTVTFSTAKDITALAGAPRVVFTNYPLGNACGRPDDPDNQRAILRAGLALLEGATRPGECIVTPHEWSQSREWMRLVFTPEQPFMAPEVEQRRRQEIAGNAAATRRG